VRYARDIADGSDPKSGRLQRANRRLSTGAGPFDEDIQLPDARVHGLPRRLLASKLGRIRRTLPRTLEAHGARAAPGDHVAIRIGDRDYRIVES
jgi:hypothetical protein